MLFMQALPHASENIQLQACSLPAAFYTKNPLCDLRFGTLDRGVYMNESVSMSRITHISVHAQCERLNYPLLILTSDLLEQGHLLLAHVTRDGNDASFRARNTQRLCIANISCATQYAVHDVSSLRSGPGRRASDTLPPRVHRPQLHRNWADCSRASDLTRGALKATEVDLRWFLWKCLVGAMCERTT